MHCLDLKSFLPLIKARGQLNLDLIKREFSIDKGEMTPTLKIKRSVIDEKYSDAIDEICG